MSKNTYAGNTKYSRRIISRFLVLVAVLFVVFGAMSFALTRINVSANSAQIMNNTGALVSGLLNDHIKAAAVRLDEIASDPLTEKYMIALNSAAPGEDPRGMTTGFSDAPKLEDILSGACSKSEDIVSAWIVSESSGILIGSGRNGGGMLTAEEFGLSERSWYQKYISGASVSEYICLETSPGIFDPDESVVTIISPLVSGGNTYAFCGMEIRADSIFSVLSKYTFNSGSYPVVACGSTVLYSPSASDFSEKFSLSDQPLENVISQKFISPGIVDSYVSESGTVYYYRETSTLSGWNVIVQIGRAHV